MSGQHTINTVTFTIETLEAQRAWKNVPQVLKALNYQSCLLLPANLSLRMEEKKNNSQKEKRKKNRLKYFIPTKLAL